jgi:F-type H+-transporting ATPase subunit a
MNSTVRGLLVFVGLIAFVAIFCVGLPYGLFGAWGVVAAIPVIEVPGEVLFPGAFPFGFLNLGWGDFTNTWLATIIADVLVLVFVGLAWVSSKGWTNEVPKGFQVWAETIVEALYGFTKQMAGDSPRVRYQLFPLVGTLFIFLLTANWMSLMPGVDTVGIMHCAHGKQSGYMRHVDGMPVDTLYNTSPLNAGTQATEEQYHACHELLEGHSHVVAQYDTEVEGGIDTVSAQLNNAELALSEEARVELVHEYEELTGYEHVAYFPTAAELERGVQPYAFVVTPFVRPAATDLNLTLGLALVAFAFIQYFGISALGLNYFQKFINLRALGELNKRPLGAIDFVVGLFEIISEFAKVISLAFRLFGNIFAGAVLIFVMHFLIATGLPIIFFGLETIVGLAQALVFAVLTLIFCAQAMVSHHHDDEHGEEAHH